MSLNGLSINKKLFGGFGALFLAFLALALAFFGGLGGRVPPPLFTVPVGGRNSIYQTSYAKRIRWTALHETSPTAFC